jgi:hypothetical protein
MDHALLRDSSKRPRKEHHIERCIWVRQILGRADPKPDILKTGLTRRASRSGDRFRIRIDSFHMRGESCDAQRESTIAAPEIQNALAAQQSRSAPLIELDQGIGPQRRRQRRDMPPDAGDGICGTASHSGRAD